jgi:protein-S-isoprenylcysteine O-methyltransferase Ste14
MDGGRTTSGSTDYDIGRLLMVLLAVAVLCVDVTGLLHLHSHGSGIAAVLQAIGDVLVIVFYAVLIWCYLRRGPAVATSRSVTAHIAAIVATWLPFALPFLHGERAGPALQTASDVLLVCGMAWSVWSLRTLGRSVSVLAQARDVVSAGPYRLVRHPLYTGEIVSTLGIAIAMNSIGAIACWLGLTGLQIYRAMREEQVLLDALPAYAAYRGSTAALLPGLRWQRRSRAAVASADLASPPT